MKPVKYVAQVAHVKEVTLHGTADLAYWQEKLQPVELQPLAADGQAQILISATEATYWGIRFREALIGIHVEPTRSMPDEMPAMYLVQAWNSLSSFAWIERNLFGTPYAAGQIAVDPRFPAEFQLSQRREPLIAAAIADAPQEPQKVTEDNWHGAIFLPRRGGRKQQLFIAKLAGRTLHFPFGDGDSLVLSRSAHCPAIDWLLDSHFTPRSWLVRQAATHAKSKTYPADQFFAS